MKIAVPEYVLSVDATGESPVELLQRMWLPRFIAAVVAAPPSAELHAVKVAPGEWLAIAFWLDRPVGHDPDELLKRGAAAFDIYTTDSFEQI